MRDGDIDELQKTLGIKFKDIKLLNQAFIHRSYLNETKQKLDSNERLEFLGDSVLSFIISSHLFIKRPQDAEGDLTNLRSYIVKTESLAQAAKHLNLGKYLWLSKGEEASGGRSNPQLLANTYEALLGAVYLDQRISAAEKMISLTLLPYFKNELISGPPKDAKSSLQEIVQDKLQLSPTYRILKTTGPDHAKHFTVGVYIKGEEYGRGVGTSKQEAEEHAAYQALEKLI